VSDQLCSAHASLRDHFLWLALSLDIAILLLSAWIVAMAFLDPAIAPYVTPPHLPAQIWIGLLSVLTFCLTLVQFRTDWKSRSEAHSRSFALYAEVKREAGYLLASANAIPEREFQRLASRYDMASDVGTGIPEGEFLRQKQKHHIKVHLSKAIDRNPGIWLPLERLRMALAGLRTPTE
jgi:hypothetical protein